MIKLHLAIGTGTENIPVLEYENKEELIDYLHELKMFDCVWLATENGELSEILITENLTTLIKWIENDFMNLETIFIQEYQSYEDAYAVALDMREGNAKCY